MLNMAKMGDDLISVTPWELAGEMDEYEQITYQTFKRRKGVYRLFAGNGMCWDKKITEEAENAKFLRLPQELRKRLGFASVEDIELVRNRIESVCAVEERGMFRKQKPKGRK